MEQKNLSLERLVFFSDAVVAIAITLLALDIRVGPTPTGRLHFSDIAELWKPLLAFVLSFFNIANFWRTHHAAARAADGGAPAVRKVQTPPKRAQELV